MTVLAFTFNLQLIWLLPNTIKVNAVVSLILCKIIIIFFCCWCNSWLNLYSEHILHIVCERKNELTLWEVFNLLLRLYPRISFMALQMFARAVYSLSYFCFLSRVFIFNPFLLFCLGLFLSAENYSHFGIIISSLAMIKGKNDQESRSTVNASHLVRTHLGIWSQWMCFRGRWRKMEDERE